MLGLMQDVLDHLRPRIANWWLPDDVVVVDALPMTATGKVSKLALREQCRDHLVGPQTSEHSVETLPIPVRHPLEGSYSQ